MDNEVSMKTYLIYFHEENASFERIVQHLNSFEHKSEVSPNVWLVRSEMDKPAKVRDIFNNLSDGKPLIIVDVTESAWASTCVDSESLEFLRGRRNNLA